MHTPTLIRLTLQAQLLTATTPEEGLAAMWQAWNSLNELAPTQEISNMMQSIHDNIEKLENM